MVFGLYLLGILFAVFTGLLLKNTLLKGEVTPFVMELPPYHVPTVRSVLFHTWDRLKAFLFRAGRLLVPVVMVLSFLSSVGTDGSYGNENTGRSVLSAIGRSITPVFAPMGIREENWPATVGIFTGIFAKEAVVGTLDAIYGQMETAEEASPEAAEAFSLGGALAAAWGTIPENLRGVKDTLMDPLGLSVGDIRSVDAAAEQQAVAIGTFGAMVGLFEGQVGAFAYLLFILLYFPCVAAMAAVYRETNLRWTLFVGAWTTGLAYMSAVTFYQAATFRQHPVASGLWFLGFGVLLIGLYAFLRRSGQRPGFQPSPRLERAQA